MRKSCTISWPPQGQATDDNWADAGGWDSQEAEGAAAVPAPGTGGSERPALAPEDIDPSAAVWRAVVLFNFEANNEDELTVAENEEVDILVRECDEEGWLLGRNRAGRRGYVPYNYVEVYECLAEDDQEQGQQQPPVNRTNRQSCISYNFLCIVSNISSQRGYGTLLNPLGPGSHMIFENLLIKMIKPG